MQEKIGIRVNSEVGRLGAVIMHKPGPEVENMTPVNAQRALYSDILNLSVIQKEYNQLTCVLGKLTNIIFVEDLLTKVLADEGARLKLIHRVCNNEDHPGMADFLMGIDVTNLASLLIEGVPVQRNNITSYLNEEKYALPPLHNFFFTRDASMVINANFIIASMANQVRERESLIMQSLFEHPALFSGRILDTIPERKPDGSFRLEGGDLIVAREDIILLGIGSRTSSKGVDYILEFLKSTGKNYNLVVQELPFGPESFIHLDMVFTLLDRDCCMLYDPLILKQSRYKTVHAEIHEGKVRSINTVENIPSILRKLGMDLEITYCGGVNDPTIQEREQWHSGANFFAFSPGKVIGYNRNNYTLENLNRAGFEILKASDVNSGKQNPGLFKRCVITIDGSELARGGGGVRCMTMPILRDDLD